MTGRCMAISLDRRYKISMMVRKISLASTRLSLKVDEDSRSKRRRIFWSYSPCRVTARWIKIYNKGIFYDKAYYHLEAEKQNLAP